MYAIIIQPGDPKAPLKARSNFIGGPTSLSPSTDLMALDTHIRDRSRHGSKYIDTRVLDNGYEGLVDEINQVPEPRVVVVEAKTLGLGQTTAIVEQVKHAFPEIPVGIFGQHPTDFPAEALGFPGVDFALSGDPEPILKRYLDLVDLPQRLEKIAGLQLPGGELKPAAFSQNLAAEVALPNLTYPYWAPYLRDDDNSTCTAELRLSRGNSGFPPDRAFPGHGQALRLFDLKSLATLMDRCAGTSIPHVSIIDPPGIWTLQRLVNWCDALKKSRNTKSWGLQFMPTLLGEGEIQLLVDSWCRKIDFIFPSCDPERLRTYGCIVEPKALKQVLQALKTRGISVSLRFWIGGPEESPGEVKRVASLIRKIGYVDYLLQPYPYHLGSQVYADYGAEQAGPDLQAFIDWARDPKHIDQPNPIWGLEAGGRKIQHTARAIMRKINRNPVRMVRIYVDRAINTRWIDKIERKAIGVDALLAEEHDELTMGRNRQE